MKFRTYLVSAAFLFGSFSISQAAVQTLSGASSNSFFDVVYDDALMGLHGTPTLLNNVISFTPTTFIAQVSGVLQAQTTSSTLNLRLVARPGFDFGNITLQERGDFFLDGTNAQVLAQGQIRAYNLATPLQEYSNNIISSTATGPAIGTLLSAIAPGSAYHNGIGYNWIGQAAINVAGTNLAPADTINFTLENILRARTGSLAPGEVFPPQAFIEKKFAGVSIVVTPIPEPSELALMLAGLGLVGVLARRRKDPNQVG
jgi:hypothetical protein